MYYPWWFVPYLTSPMLIALVAVAHVLVSHYAVGGGILLARENRYALKNKDRSYRDYWKKHARFFILLTVVYGAITGVLIWWTIGLSSPLATELLIRTFVFGWGIEWVFFIVEIVSAFAFYYYWDRLPEKTHITIGGIYALAAWISLVLITGITAFMLNSQGLFQNWSQTGSFWDAFLNRQFIPQTIVRTGGSLVLAACYVYLHAAWTETDAAVREKTIRRMTLPVMIGLGMLVVGIVGWFFFLPASSRLMLEGTAAMNIFLGVFSASSVGILMILWFGPIRAPRSMTFPGALGLFLLGIASIGSAEFIREAVRKPFIVDRVIYGNQIYVADAQSIPQRGLLASGIWTRLWLDTLQEKYPTLKIAPSSPPTRATLTTSPTTGLEAVPDTGESTPALPNTKNFSPFAGSLTESVSETVGTNVRAAGFPTSTSTRPGSEDLLKISEEDQLATGNVIFLYHCNDCHAADRGYSAVGPLLTAKSEGEIVRFVQHLNRPGYFMPPWSGNDVEAQLLAKYLTSIRPEMPENLTAAGLADPAPSSANTESVAE